MTREQWLLTLWIILFGLFEIGIFWFGWLMGRHGMILERPVERRDVREPTPAELEMMAAKTRYSEANNTFLKLLENWSNDARRACDRGNLERLADEMARADPPFSAEQRATAWKSIAMNPGDPEKLEELRAIIRTTTTTKLSSI